MTEQTPRELVRELVGTKFWHPFIAALDENERRDQLGFAHYAVMRAEMERGDKLQAEADNLNAVIFSLRSSVAENLERVSVEFADTDCPEYLAVLALDEILSKAVKS